MLQICELLQDNRQWLENLQVLLAELRFQNEWFLVNFKGSQLNWCGTNQRRLRKHYQGWLQLPMLQVYSRKVDHSSPSDAGSVSSQSQSVHSFKSLSLGILFWTVWMIYVLFPFPSTLKHQHVLHCSWFLIIENPCDICLTQETCNILFCPSAGGCCSAHTSGTRLLTKWFNCEII